MVPEAHCFRFRPPELGGGANGHATRILGWLQQLRNVITPPTLSVGIFALGEEFSGGVQGIRPNNIFDHE